MAIELHLLVWSVALAFAQMLAAVAGAILEVGLPELAGNREPVPETTGWAGRASRAHFNMLESLVLFAALVLTAVIAQRTNGTTALGAELFFWARLVYAFIYMAGIPWVRTAVWGISVIGLILIFSQVV
ncbi:MAG: MAPEG family protein [Hyphomicrobiales bacterium]|nr:MAPEG family protein [Hyphomicrobiales bacterium]MBV9519349.1 MAPEG family protein [Hyphomicrobiales bacterium]